MTYHPFNKPIKDNTGLYLLQPHSENYWSEGDLVERKDGIYCIKTLVGNRAYLVKLKGIKYLIAKIMCLVLGEDVPK